MAHSLQEQLGELHRIAQSSRSIFTQLHEKRFGPIELSASTCIEPISPLQLVIPSAFYAQVQNFHLSTRSREILSQKLDQLINDYAQRFDELAKVIQLQSLLLTAVEKLRDVMQHHFENVALPKLMEVMKEYAEKFPTQPAHTARTVNPLSKTVFNKDYTPILETYFQYDAYPSARDQEIIAERSGMSRRQIEVWFQNHRNAARRKEIPLKKRPAGSVAPNVSGPLLKEKMLDLFKKDSSSIDGVIDGPAPLIMGSGSGATPDDPIRIEPTGEVGMTITSAGNGVGVLEPIDLVERMVREKERKAREQGIKEERSKFWSIIMPRPSYPPLPVSANPLEISLTSSSNLFVPWTRPAEELQFRNLIERERFSFPAPLWARKAPESSYDVPRRQDVKDGKGSKKKLTKAEQAAQAQKAEQHDRAMNVLIGRLEMWTLGDGVYPSFEMSSTASISKSKGLTAKTKELAKDLLDVLGSRGVTLDAATCATTYKLPRAPLDALVRFTNGKPKATSPEPSIEIAVSSSQKQKKPAALGPKRKPKNAPSLPSVSSSPSILRSQPEPIPAASRESTPSGSTSGLQRQGSTSSLSSTLSSSTSTSTGPRTPSPEPSLEFDVDIAEVETDGIKKIKEVALMPQGFPEGFAPLSALAFEEYGVTMPKYYEFDSPSPALAPSGPISATPSVSVSAPFPMSTENAVVSPPSISPSVVAVPSSGPSSQISQPYPSAQRSSPAAAVIFSSPLLPLQAVPSAVPISAPTQSQASVAQPVVPSQPITIEYTFGNPYHGNVTANYQGNFGATDMDVYGALMFGSADMSSNLSLMNVVDTTNINVHNFANFGVPTSSYGAGFAVPSSNVMNTNMNVTTAGVGMGMGLINMNTHTGTVSGMGMAFPGFPGAPGMWMT